MANNILGCADCTLSKQVKLLTESVQLYQARDGDGWGYWRTTALRLEAELKQSQKDRDFYHSGVTAVVHRNDVLEKARSKLDKEIQRLTERCQLREGELQQKLDMQTATLAELKSELKEAWDLVEQLNDITESEQEKATLRKERDNLQAMCRTLHDELILKVERERVLLLELKPYRKARMEETKAKIEKESMGHARR